MNAPIKQPPTPVEDVEMGDDVREPVTPKRNGSGKRPPPADYGGEERYRRRYEYDDYPRRGGGRRDRDMERMEKEYSRMQTYSARQKLKKSTIKRQASVMARALGESESNVRILAAYVKRFSQPRMKYKPFSM